MRTISTSYGVQPGGSSAETIRVAIGAGRHDLQTRIRSLVGCRGVGVDHLHADTAVVADSRWARRRATRRRAARPRRRRARPTRTRICQPLFSMRRAPRVRSRRPRRPLPRLRPHQPPLQRIARGQARPKLAKKDATELRGRYEGDSEAKGHAESFADALQSRINGLSTDFVNRACIRRSATHIAADRQKAIDELARAKKDIQDQTKALDDLQTEARRGAPARLVAIVLAPQLSPLARQSVFRSSSDSEVFSTSHAVPRTARRGQGFTSRHAASRSRRAGSYGARARDED